MFESDQTSPYKMKQEYLSGLYNNWWPKYLLFFYYLIVALSAIGTAIAVTCCLICCFRYKKSCDPCVSLTNKAEREDHNVGANLRQYGSLAPMAHSYSNVKKMTKSFKEKLGEGGYGGVYRGNLNGHPVAVKILKETKGNGEEFINEVASISRTSHVNIVTLLGFCLNRREKALIYEFMPNGSLDKHIYDEDSKLGWQMLYKIALGIARGLEYLHRGCNSQILHFDIKPHNILLDEDFCPKISDFGLAKLCTRKDSITSTLEPQGTIGYIAPELFYRNFGGVSHKSDVYSYGMMILEMVGGRKNYSVERSHHSKIYFPRWAYQRILLEKDLNIRDMMTNEEELIAKKMTLVGLWCIQTNPSQRPAIGKVIEMLEGDMEALEIPPKPFICSPSGSEGSPMPTLDLPATKPFLNSPLSTTVESTSLEIV
ncbi:LEAF RUST 10 DISEASE-RESISTANCE LOCUS RECEPTOR-LIKE PROTEIN KINASE-like 2.5 [Lycium ferocissimum]|uniref:LEAF RUST 10 DISEASE-RESISTANCE LOCUS RECEPTOR-LIKE PROTEIN KINASE-like 2.5 n=1 Tax=Lycium ferocissimum TaxID=112874 RepID=UPI0028161598|nr:LEAF RUST 10 DISEASE-RESISTANCE LOCUS RECEPTOR-LIKE PROTEIN KINASE-like 2.5 [Lycium ferocissimum]